MNYKTLPRIYTEKNIYQGETIDLTTEQLHHLKVLRVKKYFRIFNIQEGEFLSILKDNYAIIEKKIRNKFTPPTLVLALSLIKHKEFKLAIKMATQMGVTEIQPIITDFTQISKIEMDKYLRYILSEVEQSERIDYPKMQEPIRLKQLFLRNDLDLFVLANERKRNINITTPLQQDKALSIIIGPEGGFSEEELDMMEKNIKIVNMGLGPTTLRTATAVVAAISRIHLLRSI